MGDEHPEHNVYNKALWVLDLNTGEYEGIARGMRYCFAAGSGLPAWVPDGRDMILAPANAGGRDILVALKNKGDGWEGGEIDTAGIQGVRALSTTEDHARPGELHDPDSST